ncbi:hypothetical protein SAMN04489859_102834 [Paracoccus alcaliphilus]|uniref:GTP-binding protein Era n=1 Tax=Paracoccus alcaliphilus TaxID=34002 RepID=A0A1H8L7M3_9RHOB|nr:DUF1491 family protein [Paracoccus alcaliphilus]WCR19246.1 DUF1491 family protein [Paracoccus alcaliphilus]SEO01081.1 hypothetical protein SAMN04489859_102834 [Paracoccus alcaliphilus]
MADARLAAGVWVSAYLTRLGLANIPAYVVARGDDVAGAVMVKCALLDGTARLYLREWDFETDTRPWRMTAEGPEREIDEAIRRQRGYDNDLWVIEVESREGRTLLDEDGLA